MRNYMNNSKKSNRGLCVLSYNVRVSKETKRRKTMSFLSYYFTNILLLFSKTMHL